MYIAIHLVIRPADDLNPPRSADRQASTHKKRTLPVCAQRLRSSSQGDGNVKVISELASEGALLLEESYAHKYPYDWRTKKPTIFRSVSTKLQPVIWIVCKYLSVVFLGGCGSPLAMDACLVHVCAWLQPSKQTSIAHMYAWRHTGSNANPVQFMKSFSLRGLFAACKAAFAINTDSKDLLYIYAYMSVCMNVYRQGHKPVVCLCRRLPWCRPRSHPWRGLAACQWSQSHHFHDRVTQ